MFPETLEKSSKSHPPNPRPHPGSWTNESYSRGRLWEAGVYMGKTGSWVSRAEKGGLFAQAFRPLPPPPPATHTHAHILSDSMSCVLALSIFSQNWKKRMFGGHTTSPSSCCQHPYHMVQGYRRSPKS